VTTRDQRKRERDKKPWKRERNSEKLPKARRRKEEKGERSG
jgi:hypothetical protein